MSVWERQPGSAAGQTSAELAMLVVVVSAIALALLLFAPGAVRDLFDSVSSAICNVVGLECGEPDSPCVLARDRYGGGGTLTYRSLTLGRGGVYGLERLSDGTWRVSWSETGGVGVTAGVGRRLDADLGGVEVGQSAAATGKLSVGFEEGVVGVFGSREEAIEFVRLHAAGRALDTFATSLLRPGPGALLPSALPDLTAGLVDAHWPDLDRYVAVRTGSTLSASLRVVLGGIGGLLGTDLGLRLSADGSKSLYSTVRLDLSGTLGLPQVPGSGATASGALDLIATTEFGADNSAKLLTLEASLGGEVSGAVVELISGSSGRHLSGAGVLTVHLDLSDRSVRDALAGIGAGLRGSGSARTRAVRELFALIRTRGEVTWVTYDEQSDDVGTNVSSGAGSSFGFALGAATTHSRVRDAKFLDPDSGWRRWSRCLDGASG